MIPTHDFSCRIATNVLRLVSSRSISSSCPSEITTPP